MTRKEAELTRAGEAIRREQQQRQQKDRELAQAQQQIQTVDSSYMCCIYNGISS